ncbi:MAG: response regulator, partial [Planctomycetales bacterium]|nr:response regulator [Planctomycetales bacterium]
PRPQQIASHLLERGHRAVAELVFARLEPLLANPGNAPARSPEYWTAKIEMHLHTLAACIEFSSPLLLADYVRWGRVTPEPHPHLPNEVATIFRLVEDVTRLEFPHQAGAVVARYIRTALQAEQVEKTAEAASSPLAELQQEYLTALLTSNRAEAVRLSVEAVHAGIDVGQFYLDVLQPSQREIGRRWQAGELSVAQEHYCTAVTQFVMSQLQPYFLQKHAEAKTLVACCVGDELHEVGLRIVSDIFEMEGWNTIYLGANTPADGVSHALLTYDATVLAISTTMTRHLFALAQLIASLRANPDCQKTKIMVGGYPFNIDPYLWQRVGADAGASSVSEAIRIADSYVSTNNAHSVRPRSSQWATVSPTPSLSPSENAARDDLSRMNNELLTAQRQLHQAHVQMRQLHEVNELKSKTLQEADRRKDEFLAMLAHELRGPLAPMQHALTILGMDNVDRNDIADARKTLQRQLQQMSHLIGDLLDASRIVHGKINLASTRVNLSEVVERAIEISRPLLHEKSHTFRCDVHSTPIHIDGDLIRLTQVVANLLSNAAKYTEDGGVIELGIRREGDRAVIEVRDNGIGLEAELIPQIFDTFVQEQRGRIHSQGGLGLGLSLVKQLVELHRGTVHAESLGPGQGSTFVVRLPAVEASSEGDIESADGETAEEEIMEYEDFAMQRRVLVVDDTAGIAKITARLFQMLGHETLIALDGKAALEKFQQFTPHIVVLDLMLPDMSGFAVAQAMRALGHYPRPLIVAQTGNSDAKNRQQAQEAGFDEYLVKPVHVAELRKLGSHRKLQAAGEPH